MFQDRFMLLFWLNYPMRNDLHTTRVVAKRAFNALDQNDKDNKNYVIQGKNTLLAGTGVAPSARTTGDIHAVYDWKTENCVSRSCSLSLPPVSPHMHTDIRLTLAMLRAPT